jgi:hypothetical protein
MKSPYIIGALSVAPGLGLLVLRRFKAVLLVWALEAVGVWIFLSSSGLPAAGFGAFIVIATWVIQIHYAIQSAKQQERREEAPEGRLPVYGEARDVRGELDVSAAGIIQPHLAPGEELIASAVGMRPAPGGFGTKQYAVGVTPEDVVIISLRPWGISEAIERIPLEKVVNVRLEQGSLTDEIELQVEGEAEGRAFYFYTISRPHVERIARVLEGAAGPQSEGLDDGP